MCLRDVENMNFHASSVWKDKMRFHVWWKRLSRDRGGEELYTITFAITLFIEIAQISSYLATCRASAYTLNTL